MPSKMSNSQESNLYVVSFPNSLNFYAEDSPPFRQVLKIYNTYEFPIKFRVLCTCPQKYVVIVPEGLIRPSHHADITIQLNDVSPENFNKTDVFRIEFRRYHKNSKTKSADYGVREVTATFLPGKCPRPVEKSFEQTTSDGSAPAEICSANEFRSFGADEDKSHSDFIMRIAIAVALVSTLGLMFPLTGDVGSFIPEMFHLTPQFKQVLAFASGMSIGFILRQQI